MQGQAEFACDVGAGADQDELGTRVVEEVRWVHVGESVSGELLPEFVG